MYLCRFRDFPFELQFCNEMTSSERWTTVIPPELSMMDDRDGDLPN
jgi:hypothetical protein